MKYATNFIQQPRFIITISLFLILSILLLVFFIPHSFSANAQQQQQQPITLKDLVTYNGQSSFIMEFPIPLAERGLKGTITDSQGNAWFYHSTNKTSTIIKLDIIYKKFSQYYIGGNTTVDDFIINLAGGQLAFDNSTNTLWFTDARTNSIGKLDIAAKNGKVELIKIPTAKSGPMGIALSPDHRSIWFAEITGDKIARLDVNSNKVLEYPTGENTGPTLLTFDNKGVLWITMSYSHNILRVEPWAVVPGRSSFGISTITLPKPDMFSPFGIAIANTGNKTATAPTFGSSPASATTTTTGGIQKMFVSDHGSSRVISSATGDVSPDFTLQSYTSYWTSPSQVYPTTLPGQIVADKLGKDIYFPEHGGNRIAKINIESGEMTEYDIPTGPLSTTIFIAVSDDGKRVWFTEWASNKVAYLDTTIPIPFNLKINNKNNSPTILNANQSKTVEALLNANKNTSSLSLAQVEIALIGMSDSGLKGVTYTANPHRIDMQQYPINKSQITLNVEQDQSRSGQYTAMVRASTSEKKDQLLFVSLLYPILLRVDVPTSTSQQQQQQQQQQNSFQNNNNNQKSGFAFDEPFRSIIRFLALPVAIGLIGLAIYGRIKRSKRRPPQQQP
jgi:streptogramin lyase